jgi:hypothetical protein
MAAQMLKGDDHSGLAPPRAAAGHGTLVRQGIDGDLPAPRMARISHGCLIRLAS